MVIFKRNCALDGIIDLIEQPLWWNTFNAYEKEFAWWSDRLGETTALVDQLSYQTNRLDINVLVKRLL